MPLSRILVLGGTTEAREAAHGLQVLGHEVVYSLAGVTVSPLLPQTRLCLGGFGGVDGLVLYLMHNKIEAVLDATHPFAAIMSRHAHAACLQIDVTLARLERPAWQPKRGDYWLSAHTLTEAAELLPPGARVLLTTGRRGISQFTSRFDISGVIRTIERPADILPPHWELLLDRPPFSRDDEIDLMKIHGITHVVSKNAGSSATGAKLDAARALGLPVVMIERPSKPQCRRFPDVKTLLEQQSQWLGSA